MLEVLGLHREWLKLTSEDPGLRPRGGTVLDQEEGYFDERLRELVNSTVEGLDRAKVGHYTRFECSFEFHSF